MSDVERSTDEFRLEAISPIDGRYASQTQELSPYFSEYGLIKTRFEVETRYLLALSDIGIVRPLSEEERDSLSPFLNGITTDDALATKKIEERTHHDVNALIERYRNVVHGTSLADVTEAIHLGWTSEDANNLAHRLNLLRATQEIIIPHLDTVTDNLIDRADRYKSVPMLARTHGQPAVPTTVGKELIVFASRLNTEVRGLAQQPLTGKVNGAVGNMNGLFFAYPQIDWRTFSQDFIRSLKLKPNMITTQINSPEDLIAYFQVYHRLNGVLIDLNQDMWRYISDEWIGQENRAEEVGSSTMTQKINPIQFENSEGNLKIANGLFDTLATDLATSRLQRDLSGSTLMRNIGPAVAHSLVAYNSLLNGLSRIQIDEEKIAEALNRDWAILGEGVQISLRAAGVSNAYDLIKGLTRGRHIGPDEWHQWLEELPVEEQHKAKLRQLTPQTYIGYAVELTDYAIEEIRASRQ